MIKKRPFKERDALDEPIYFKFGDGEVKQIFWIEDNKKFTLRAFIERNIDDANIFPQYAELKNKYQALLLEHQELQEKHSKFKEHQGKGRKPGTYKLNNKQIKEVLKMYEEGISKRQIAFKFKVDEKTIRNIIKRER